ncbi:Eco57I restriction-modification methylase domain-containing protein [Luteibacter sp.]|uniref:Eco57I restriction-modification methylase domain-containing protein n=1 Tax=Luteibacter sp. TaxID=1886636 RepID=UPI00280977BF|nr:Eco57I restriction-modification methylase domain-containing protein [Luteibacter sp.]MDQ8048083.1 Eco57I restriction-modification methylase domain-containing protein [Luteibacter sp.]
MATPPDIVKLIWTIAHEARSGAVFPSVVDLGAGDARFSSHGRFLDYRGIESDRSRVPSSPLPPNASIRYADAMRMRTGRYDLAIGNPPYIRHHHLEPEWRDETLSLLENAGGPRLKATANLFVMFLLQALLKTRADGLVVQLVPFEWVTRPSASELRDYIRKQNWSVKVLRFDVDIFPSVLTTASITVIDKADKTGTWTFGSIGRGGRIKEKANPSGTGEAVLPYGKRSEKTHALRGLSPGGQDIFVLTEEQRLFHGLRRGRDVMPCVTSLRNVSRDIDVLDRETFESMYVSSGRPAWLIRSDKPSHSPELTRYLKGVGNAWERYTTCTIRKLWWQYRNHAVPQILVSSGFVDSAPKVLNNEIGAMAVGSVYGVHHDESLDSAQVSERLRRYDFRKRVVSHANDLRKIEIGQLNTVLKRLFG